VAAGRDKKASRAKNSKKKFRQRGKQMRIVVCVKQVPDTTEVRIDPETNTLMRQGVPSILNPYDAHAVEAAARLKEKYGGEVIALSMGPQQAEAVLKKAVSLGADRGIILSDRAFAGADTLATSYILSRGIQKIQEESPVDLVFCGKQAIDGDTAQVGPGIAVRLSFTQLTFVEEIEELDLVQRRIRVARKLLGGTQVVEGRLPALLTVTKELNELRYSSLPRMIAAARFKAVIWNKNDINPEPEKIGLKGSPTSVRKIFPPPPRAGGEIIAGGMEDPAGAARELAGRLVKNLVTADR